MSKNPPSLVHFVVYNPTLLPPEPTEDEDVREEAHVLFYTANDRAVSKDRVLRQVGLAKALASFTTVFDPDAVCESVHSQGRRMIMFSPEPDYWMHACFELEKVLRSSSSPPEAGKSKGKQKESTVVYNEASLHDEALRARLCLGYEAFKLTHGSFTSIMAESGKDALGVQLEHFFTAWLWKQDFSKQMAFSDYVGIRAHHLSNHLVPLIETLEGWLPTNYSPLVLVASCVVAPKSAFLQFPPDLVWYFRNVLERRSASPHVERLDAQKSSEAKSHVHASANSDKEKNINPIQAVESRRTNTGGRRKWEWVDVLTLGLRSKSSGTDEKKEETVSTSTDAHSEPQTGHKEAHEVSRFESTNFDEGRRIIDPIVDIQALIDALATDDARQIPADSKQKIQCVISSDLTHGLPLEASVDLSASDPCAPEEALVLNGNVALVQDEDAQGRGSQLTTAEVTGEHPLKATAEARSEVGLMFSECPIYISNLNSSQTYCTMVKYVKTESTLLALVPRHLASKESEYSNFSQDLAEKCTMLVQCLKEAAESEQQRINLALSSSPIQTVLQKSRCMISAPGKLIYLSAPFPSTSWHLFEGKRILDTQEVQEVYSRRQSPQDWYLAKRIVETRKEGSLWKGQIFMEIECKEASLVDVENEILAAIRRFSE